jgi:hypothetical protein
MGWEGMGWEGIPGSASVATYEPKQPSDRYPSEDEDDCGGGGGRGAAEEEEEDDEEEVDIAAFKAEEEDEPLRLYGRLSERGGAAADWPGTLSVSISISVSGCSLVCSSGSEAGRGGERTGSRGLGRSSTEWMWSQGSTVDSRYTSAALLLKRRRLMTSHLKRLLH